MPAAPEVLYIHPFGHLNDRVVPSGALSVVNGLGVPCRGRYADEVRRRDLEAARVVLLDVHWALGLQGAARVLAEVRRVNPRARTVVGGITASAWPERILASLGPDYVVAGDAEVATAALVAALLADREPGVIANVWRAGAPPPPRRRLTVEEFSATDTVTADWFPSYHRAARERSEPFSQAPHVIVARGCVHRCRTCYGSYAGSFGGLLVRTPESTAGLVRRAAAVGHNALRFFFGALPLAPLERTLAAMAARPTHFSEGVGLYVCTPLDEDLLSLLRTAFPRTAVALSAVWPAEHERPSLDPDKLAEREARFVAMARAATGSLEAEFWYCQPGSAPRIAAAAAAGGGPVSAHNGYVWNLARPDERSAAGDPVRDQEQWDGAAAVSRHAHAYQLARRLSPPLEALFEPFGDLDVLPGDPDDVAPPAGDLAPWWTQAMASWRTVGAPLLPDLRFWLVPVARPVGVPLEAVRLAAGSFAYLAAPAPLALRLTYAARGPVLVADLPVAEVGVGYAVLPSLAGDPPESLRAAAATAVVGVRLAGGGRLRLSWWRDRLRVALDAVGPDSELAAAAAAGPRIP